MDERIFVWEITKFGFITNSLDIGQNFVRVRYSPGGFFFTPQAYKSRCRKKKTSRSGYSRLTIGIGTTIQSGEQKLNEWGMDDTE